MKRSIFHNYGGFLRQNWGLLDMSHGTSTKVGICPIVRVYYKNVTFVYKGGVGDVSYT
jgi:hypothetical protein